MEQARPTPDQIDEFEDQHAELRALLDPSEAVRRALQVVPGIVGLGRTFAGIAVADESMTIEHLHGTATEALRGLRVERGHGLGGKVLATGEAAWVRDYADSSEITHHYDPVVVNVEGLRGIIAVPLTVGQRLHGVLYAASGDPSDFGDRAVESMTEAGRAAAAAIMVAERARHAAEVAALEERRRIAMSLHDSVGAMLFALTASVRSLGLELQRDPALAAKVESIERRAHDASVALRESLHALTVSPGELALTVVLRAHCRDFQERTGIPTRLIQMDDLPVADPARVEALVAAVREGLLNVEKHASARSVVVTAFPSRGGIAVAVSDDGVGICQSATDGRGIGLGCLDDRVGRVGGTAQVADNDDGGTTLRTWVPC